MLFFSKKRQEQFLYLALIFFWPRELKHTQGRGEAEVCCMPGLPAWGWHRVPLSVCEPGNRETPAPSPPVTPQTSSSPCLRLPCHPPSTVPTPWAQGSSTGAVPTRCPLSILQDSTREEGRQRATTLTTLVFFLSSSGQISAME